MFYLVKTPWVVKKVIYPEYIWSIPTDEKKIYLSFDDGPHPVATRFVLDTLKQFNARASFFCIGKNVAAHPELYHRIITEGHTVGNHTYDHLNGWKSDNETYISNIAKASTHIISTLFRPPYGKITRPQARQLKKQFNLRIVMWSVLSGDFDIGLTPQVCLQNVLKATRPGSIVVFHDSEKAFDKITYALPVVLEHYLKQGYLFEKINL